MNDALGGRPGDACTLVIEQDGPRYRWVLMLGERRLAKAARWWNTEDEARSDYDDFVEALEEM